MLHLTCPGAPDPNRRVRRALKKTGVNKRWAILSQFLITNGVSPHVLTNVVYVLLVQTPFGLCVKYGVATTLEPREGLFGKTPGRLATLQQMLKREECSIICILAVILEDVAKGVIKTQLERYILKETEGHKVVLGNHKEFRDLKSLNIFDEVVPTLLENGVKVYQIPEVHSRFLIHYNNICI